MAQFIDEDVVRQVKQTANVYDTISQFLTLKKVGQGYTAKCPFHNELSESFTVSQSKNIFKCFGCGKSGNSISFLMEHKQMNYATAIKWLAERNNITIIYKS